MAQRRQVLRRAVKSAAANVFHYTGVRRAICAARRFRSGGRRVLILSYHRVVSDFTGAVQTALPGLLISKETLRQQIQDLRRSGYEVVPLGTALAVLSGRKAAKQDLCVLTFDDGYRDVYKNAFPVLKELEAPATAYLASGLVGTKKRLTHDRLFHLLNLLGGRGLRPVYDALPPAAAAVLEPLSLGQVSLSESVDTLLASLSSGIVHRIIEGLEAQLGSAQPLLPEDGELMTWDEARELAASGLVELGAHTVTHTVLPLEDLERAEWEVLESKAQIEREVGRPCLDFAYCNGWYSEELVKVLAGAGFRSAVTTEDLPNRIGGDLFTLKRKVLWENFSVGFDGTYSSCLTGCQMDDVFTSLGGGTVVPGRKPQRLAARPAVPFTEPGVDAQGGL